jgi:hypothetical protein
MPGQRRTDLLAFPLLLLGGLDADDQQHHASDD